MDAWTFSGDAGDVARSTTSGAEDPWADGWLPEESRTKTTTLWKNCKVHIPPSQCCLAFHRPSLGCSFLARNWIRISSSESREYPWRFIGSSLWHWLLKGHKACENVFSSMLVSLIALLMNRVPHLVSATGNLGRAIQISWLTDSMSEHTWITSPRISKLRMSEYHGITKSLSWLTAA